ncbi:transmembrane ascorbate-dependent reductase CYB561-like isoform X2 [Venturia canescens]|nr:transmembrane ascorbate-dependent reductase CYB561-like isoform X2 [Venturia canescens]
MDEIGPAVQPRNLQGFNLLLGATEFFGGVLIVLMAVWLNNFRGGFAWTEDPAHQFNWHPLLMTIGLVYLYANGMLIYRTRRNMRKRNLKLIHGGIMILVILLTTIALIAVFDSHNLNDKPIPNMYTLHSWVGLTSVILFCCQWLAGGISFLWPGIETSLREAYMPVHVYFGTAGFVAVIASCLIGLNEKAFFSLPNSYAQLPTEGLLINVIGLIFVIFGALTVYIVSQQRYKRDDKYEDSYLLGTREN